MATAWPLLSQAAPPFDFGRTRRSMSPVSASGHAEVPLSSVACPPRSSHPSFAPARLFPSSCSSSSAFSPVAPAVCSPASAPRQLRGLNTCERVDMCSQSRRFFSTGRPPPFSSLASHPESACEAAGQATATSRAGAANSREKSDVSAEIQRFVESEEERESEEAAPVPELWAPKNREMQSFPWSPVAQHLECTQTSLKLENARKKGTVLLPRFASPPLSCFPLSSAKPIVSAFKAASPPTLEEKESSPANSLVLAVFTVDHSPSSRSALPLHISGSSSSPHSAEYALQDFPPSPSSNASSSCQAHSSSPSSSSSSSGDQTGSRSTRTAPACLPSQPEALLLSSSTFEEPSAGEEATPLVTSREDEDGSREETFITSSVFFKEQRFFSSISWAMFFLGVGVFLPWNCLVMEMATFDVAYFPTFPWTEAATQVRTACFFLGQLLLLWLGPRLQLIQRTVSTLIFSSVTTIALALVAAWVPENPAFHFCCVLSGIIGVQGSLLHASVYVLHAVIHHELAVDWSIGGGLAGPLTALLAFPLYFLLPASKEGQRIGTLCLFGFSAIWSLLAAGALCLGARHPSASAALLRQEASVRQKQREGGLSRSFSWAKASSGIARLSRSLSWFGGQRETSGEPEPRVRSADEHPAKGGDTATPHEARARERRDVEPSPDEMWKGQEEKELTVGEVAAEVEKAAMLGEETPYILGRGTRALAAAPEKRVGEADPLLSFARAPAFVGDDLTTHEACRKELAASQKALLSASWRRRDVFWAIRANLVTCFLLFLSTYLVYPVTTEHMLPSSSVDFVLFQMILVACFQAGNVLGRFCVFWGCRASFAWLLPLVLLRLLMIPLFFFLDGSLGRPVWTPAPLASPPTVSEADIPSSPAAHAIIIPPESASLSSLSSSAGPSSAFLAPSTSETAAATRAFSHFFSANEGVTADASLFLLMVLFATLHGWLSVLGAFYATQVPRSTPQKETAAYLMCVAESCGIAVGVALSVLWASLAGEHPLSPHKAAHTPPHSPLGEGLASAVAETLGPSRVPEATAVAAPSAGADTRSIGLQRVPKLG
ncbi:putative transmembrane protein [Toxoplasma gondii TgCatPRC2]|uniref:Transmembrane protein n=4 Tax=Toxoplasma gondii TaxID=5811 RepID=S7VZ74_TOXGG|nr:hypothetical protein TGME49_210820 [Toxoplasma gondii ME49]EPR58308.1 hypothetical protein TGGT1_210820 [Toxoplasma gondii GT1]EPT31362.1 hypothetical protein TGME49_210820 [Toxoplasma gondii ME49]KAF4645089.1 hypothetical protein TGRH88_009050 [Toxoplasma gondii]KYK63834.1 putative transmembrane protein [Toxoplasma gondii TgCatPRC2]|eukprot:XP_002371237.2 hypothetical protein TGME49_210820 [Toxoplasma gondii ME49]